MILFVALVALVIPVIVAVTLFTMIKILIGTIKNSDL
jgi:hypothetical protein